MDERNPFPGLRPFDADESHLFFGREKATDELLGKLRSNRFIAVVGTSGSGKSSLVRAGALPDLYGGFMAGAGSSWRVALFRPHDRPIHELAKALASKEVLDGSDEDELMRVAITETVLRRGALGLLESVRQARLPEKTNLLVVVDQFEELFRLRAVSESGAKDEAAAFVKLLLESTRQNELPIYVMLTMRSEYLGDCTRFRDLPEAINDGQYLIPRMTRDQRRQAIMGPVAVGGGTIDPPLVQRLLNDVGDNPDQLPIMQHAMMRTWDIWVNGPDSSKAIGIGHYEATGGMSEALSRHADEAYDELADAHSRAVAAKLFKRLTGRGADNREMRYPATLDDLCALTGASRERVVAVIDTFRQAGRSFLMPPSGAALEGDSLIDISHESLIRIWKRLKRWVDEESVSARIYTRLAETSDLHRQHQAGLWRNPDLQIALNWRKDSQPNSTWADRYPGDFAQAMRFLDASQAAARRRKLATIATPVATVASILAFVYFQQMKKLTELDFYVELFQEQAAQAQQEADGAQARLQQVRALESEQARSTKEVRRELDQRIATLNGELDRARVEGGDQGRMDGLQLALATARTQAQTLDSIQTAAESVELSSALAPGDELEKLEVVDPVDTGTVADKSVQLAALEASPPSTASDPTDETSTMPVTATTDTAPVSTTAAPEAPDPHSAFIASPDDFLTCQGVKYLECEGASERFAPGKIYVFAQVRAPMDTSLRLEWRRDGEILRSSRLKVKQNTDPGFRTFTWRSFYQPGNYEIRLFNDQEQVIGARNFSIIP
jgi:energy-coupling factor transporter ATP-binding protein EcfA2